jgi:hypothetical protein
MTELELQREMDAQNSAQFVPGPGVFWRVIQRGETYRLQVRSFVGGGHWESLQPELPSLAEALELAVSLFSVDRQVFPTVQ